MSKLIKIQYGRNNIFPEKIRREKTTRSSNTKRKRAVEDRSIIVDLSSRRVEKGKEEIHLTSKEYGILRLLLLHQGKVMTHRQLLREIWGPQHEEDTHYLRVHIAHLRQKLGDSDPENRIIRAESGLGYRIVADGAE